MTKLERYDKILALRKIGYSYRKIGKIFGISHARVEQIVNRPPKYIVKRMEAAR